MGASCKYSHDTNHNVVGKVIEKAAAQAAAKATSEIETKSASPSSSSVISSPTSLSIYPSSASLVTNGVANTGSSYTPYQLRTVPCLFYTTPSGCTRAKCPYQHLDLENKKTLSTSIDSKASSIICDNYLKKDGCNKGKFCNSRHERMVTPITNAVATGFNAITNGTEWMINDYIDVKHATEDWLPAQIKNIIPATKNENSKDKEKQQQQQRKNGKKVRNGSSDFTEMEFPRLLLRYSLSDGVEMITATPSQTKWLGMKTGRLGVIAAREDAERRGMQALQLHGGILMYTEQELAVYLHLASLSKKVNVTKVNPSATTVTTPSSAASFATPTSRSLSITNGLASPSTSSPALLIPSLRCIPYLLRDFVDVLQLSTSQFVPAQVIHVDTTKREAQIQYLDPLPPATTTPTSVWNKAPAAVAPVGAIETIHIDTHPDRIYPLGQRTGANGVRQVKKETEKKKITMQCHYGKTISTKTELNQLITAATAASLIPISELQKQRIDIYSHSHSQSHLQHHDNDIIPIRSTDLSAMLHRLSTNSSNSTSEKLKWLIRFDIMSDTIDHATLESKIRAIHHSGLTWIDFNPVSQYGAPTHLFVSAILPCQPSAIPSLIALLESGSGAESRILSGETSDSMIKVKEAEELRESIIAFANVPLSSIACIATQLRTQNK